MCSLGHRGWMLHMAFSYKVKILRTTASFPPFKHTAFYFPPSAAQMVPLSLQKGASFSKLNFFLAFVFLRFHTAEEVHHIPFIPSDSHSGFYFPPFAKANGPPLSPERETCCRLPLYEAFCIITFCIRMHSVLPL